MAAQFAGFGQLVRSELVAQGEEEVELQDFHLVLLGEEGAEYVLGLGDVGCRLLHGVLEGLGALIEFAFEAFKFRLRVLDDGLDFLELGVAQADRFMLGHEEVGGKSSLSMGLGAAWTRTNARRDRAMRGRVDFMVCVRCGLG